MRQSDDWTDASGHGTACAGIVSRGLMTRIELLAVRLVDGERGSSPLALAEAIRWAAAEGARVINISLGAETWKDETSDRVEAACREATQRGVVIVAAAGPKGKEPLPAILPDVVAVGAAFCPSDVLYAADEGYIELLARGDLQRVAWLSGGSVLAQGARLFGGARVARRLQDPARRALARRGRRAPRAPRAVHPGRHGLPAAMEGELRGLLSAAHARARWLPPPRRALSLQQRDSCSGTVPRSRALHHRRRRRSAGRPALRTRRGRGDRRAARGPGGPP